MIELVQCFKIRGRDKIYPNILDAQKDELLFLLSGDETNVPLPVIDMIMCNCGEVIKIISGRSFIGCGPDTPI